MLGNFWEGLWHDGNWEVNFRGFEERDGVLYIADVGLLFMMMLLASLYYTSLS